MPNEMYGIFTRKASDKLRSPDDLDEYLRGTRPSVWVVLLACATLLVGLFSWAFFGTAETNVSTTGTCVRDEVICFLRDEAASRVHVGDHANVDGTLMEVTSISPVPLSFIEAREIVGNDFLANTLVQSDWSYLVHLGDDAQTSFAEGIPLKVSITIENVAPIKVVFKDVD